MTTYFDQFEFAECLNYYIRNYVARIAVPFYFAAAGFFLFRKIDLEKFDVSVTQNYIFKLLRLLGIWTVLLFAGGKGQLWYMSGLVVAVCFLSFCLYKRIDFEKILVCAIIFFFIGLIGDPYYRLLTPLLKSKITGYPIKTYYEIFSTTRNGLFMGFPFLLLGGFIEKKRFSIKPIFAFLGFFISMALLFCEVWLIRKWELSKGNDVDMYIFLLPVIFFLLIFAVNISIKPRKIYKKLRNVGVILYFSHMFVYYWIKSWCYLFIEIILKVNINNSIIDYFLTVIITTILGFVIDGLSRKEKFAFLRYLYS